MKQRTPANIPSVVLPLLLLISVLTVLVLALSDSMSAGAMALSAGAKAAGGPPCEPDEEFCRLAGDFSAVSISGTIPLSETAVTGPSAPAFGALVYDPDFVKIEQAAREKLRCGLDVRVALSPYKGNVEFETYVKQFDYEAGWGQPASDLGDACLGYTENLLDVIDAADQRLREARDLYAYLAVYAPEHRFRADGRYMTEEAPAAYSDYWGLSQTLCGDPEEPDPAGVSGEVLPPVIDWCDFPARLRQSVREAAHLRLLFGQQFMVDAMGLHFSGTSLIGGEDAVRAELAGLRAAKHQYEKAEQGLAEALGRAVGSGCYVSDFYRQPEWSLLSRAAENQETAQHQIAVRLSYLDIDSPEEVPQVRAAAQDALRQASIEGYVRLIGIAAQAATGPLCGQGERPDGQLVADMALNLLETRRQSREMADGRNVFGFDVAFTPARTFKASDVTACDQISSGDGLWEMACGAAEEAQTLQQLEVANTRAFDDAQGDLLDEIDEIRDGIDSEIEAVSGCSNLGDDQAWYDCVAQQGTLLASCWEQVTDDDTGPANPFDACMDDPRIENGEAKQTLYDLRSIYMQYLKIRTQVVNIDERIQLSDDRNATVTKWLGISGAAETAARVSQAALQMVSCFKPVSGADPLAMVTGAGIAAGCAAAGTVNLVAQATAGALSTAADVEIENAQQYEEVQNLLLDQAELVIDAYAARQHFSSKNQQFAGLLDGLKGDLVEAQRQRAYFQHCPANDPSYRIVRDSSRMQLANKMAYAARLAYLAARRAEYEYAARLAASNFRISDIYRARTAEDLVSYLDVLASTTSLLAGGASYQTNPSDFTISVARHLLLLTDEALEKEGIPEEQWQQVRTERFRQWVADNTVPNDFEDPKDGKPVLRFRFTTSLLDGGLFSQVIQQAYDRFWLLKLSGYSDPKSSNQGLRANLRTEQEGLSYQTVALTQGGLVHMRSFAGCTFDYRLIAPAALLGLEWPAGQDPEVATAVWRASVNGLNDCSEPEFSGFCASEFLGRAVSSTDWELLVFAGAPVGGWPDMDLQQLTDIELILSTTYASRTPGEPELSECTRIDW